jgi:hypothetical protein
MIKVGSKWKHFKGGEYTIVGHSQGCEGEELVPRVHYIGGDGVIYSRPVANFLEPVEGRAPARFEPWTSN